MTRFRDDRGSVPLALLIIVVGMAVAASLTPIVAGQQRTTRHAAGRSDALGAASSGIQAALAQIRAARVSSGLASLTDLPCGPLTGVVGAGNAHYEVTIDYLPENPAGHSQDWIAANRISCQSGAGPVGLPWFARLTSSGAPAEAGPAATAPTRRLRATYPIRLAGITTGGGLIRLYGGPSTTGDSAVDLCLDAGSATPAAGTVLSVAPCVDGQEQQVFGYNGNLTLSLVSSRTSANPLGVCVDAGPTHLAGTPVGLSACEATTSPRQQWILNDVDDFEGTSDGVDPDGLCLATSGGFVVLGAASDGTCRQGPSPVHTFLPDPEVGAGAPGAATNQVVNFGRFARCLTVTDGEVSSPYLVASVCRQAPDPDNVPWTQRWAVPLVPSDATSGTGEISVSAPSGRFCLRSPGTQGPGQYVTLSPCPAGTPPTELAWTVYADTGAVSTSYRIIDGFGACLAPTDPLAVPSDTHPGTPPVGKLIVVTCDAAPVSADLQWNAPPDLLTATSLVDIGER